jgi:predicted permease
VAATFALLGGSLLLIASLERVRAIDPGFAPESLLTLRVAPPPERYDAPADVVSFFSRAEERVRQLPGVVAVGGVNTLPISSPQGRGQVSVDGAVLNQPPEAGFLRVTEGYFDAIRLPLVEGRGFTPADRGPSGGQAGSQAGGGEFVTVVNESLAKRLWPNESAIGRRIKVGPPANEPWLRIVGVVRDHRQDALEADAGYQTYEPVAQRPRSVLRLAVRTSGDASSLAPAVTNALRNLEPLVIIDQVATMDERIEASLKPRRLQTWLWGAFAALATLVAAAGVYGVASWAVRSRKREFGIRMALGAAPRRIAGEAAWVGVGPVVAGLAIGLPLAVAAGRSLGALLYGISGSDTSTLGVAGLVLGVVAVLSVLPPALLAASTAPSRAIRDE